MKGRVRGRGRLGAAVGLSLCLAAAGAGAAVLDAIAARVDTAVITWSRVLQERELLRREGATGEALEPAAVRDALVRRELLLAEARKLRLEPASGAVAEQTARWEDRHGKSGWGELALLGLDRAAIADRLARLALVEAYLALRREMTFVPEAEIRTQYGRRSEDFGGRPLAEVREAVRSHLAQTVFQRELDQWIERQIKQGRVWVNPLPES
ncbi:MAG: hypothetical protein AB1578_03435 [Thermodesulfobacteriota bacterium]